MSLRLKITIIGLGLLLITGIVFLFSKANKPADSSVSISNLGSCAKRINPKVTETLGLQIYTYIKAANDFNHTPNKPSYKSEIRKDSCKELDTKASSNNIVTSTSAILDIPAAKQSWKITWAWVPRNQTLATDIGAATAECLPASDLIYGDFHCTNVLSLIRYGTPHYDPILKYVPYSGSTFNLEYSPASKAVTVTVLVPEVWASDPSVAQNIENSVPKWFAENGLNIDNYSVSYVVTTKKP